MLVTKGHQGASAEVRTSLFGPLPANWTPLASAVKPVTRRASSLAKKEKQEELESIPPEIRDAYRRFKDMLSRRGTRGIFSLGRLFHIIDDDHSGSLSLDEFRKAMKDFRVDLDEDETVSFFKYFDKDHSGSISYDEFLVAIRGNLNPIRKEIVDVAFDKFDVTGDGQISIDDLRGVYDPSKHPLVVQGKKDPEEVLLEFLDTFDSENKDGIVTRDEFHRYYANVSASVDEDVYFVEMIKRCWKLDREYQYAGAKEHRFDSSHKGNNNTQAQKGNPKSSANTASTSHSSANSAATAAAISTIASASPSLSSSSAWSSSSSPSSFSVAGAKATDSRVGTVEESDIVSNIEKTDGFGVGGSSAKKKDSSSNEQSAMSFPAWSSSSVQITTKNSPSGTTADEKESPRRGSLESKTTGASTSLNNNAVEVVSHRRRSILNNNNNNNNNNSSSSSSSSSSNNVITSTATNSSGNEQSRSVKSESITERPRLTISQIRGLIESQLSNAGGKTWEDLFLLARNHLAGDDKDLRMTSEQLEFLMKAAGMFNSMGAENLARLFDSYSLQEDDKVSFAEFVESIRKPVNQKRKKIIDQAFQKLDVVNKGYATAEDIRRAFNSKYERDVRTGKLTDEAATKQIIAKLCGVREPQIVSKERFCEYYYNVSASIDDDNYFMLLVWNTWSLSGSKHAKKSGVEFN